MVMPGKLSSASEVLEVKLLYIGMAGAFGSIARYLVSGWAAALWGTTFPFGTLVVNLVGSFFIGMIMQIGLSTDLISPEARAILTVGLLGGFTTYSSFNYETVAYFQNGEFAKALLNSGLMLTSCFVAGVVGIVMGKWLIQP